MDLRPFAAFLLGTLLTVAVESDIAVRFRWGPCTQTIRAEEHYVHPSLIRSPSCPVIGLL